MGRFLRVLPRLIRYAFIAAIALAVCDQIVNACYLAFHTARPAIIARPGAYDIAPAVASTDECRRLFAATAESTDGTDRLAAAEAAAKHLTNLVLFAEGRGMHSPPLFARYFDWIGLANSWKKHQLRQWFAGSTGVIFDGPNTIVGFKHTEYQGVPVIAQGCAVCHAGKVLGQVVPGLGNKNIDPFALASTGQALECMEKCDESCETATRRLAQGAASFRDRVTDNRLANLTQGMVSVATIEAWFYEQVNEPLPPNVTRSAVKVPALWGYGEKRKAGQFCDGMGEGMATGWPAMVELVGGQQAETVRGYADVLQHSEELLGDLLPPAYPLTINPAQAKRGKTTYADQCQRCHGTHEKDRDFLPVFKTPRHVPIEEVGTDDNRLRNVTPEFLAMAARNPLNDLIRFAPDYRPGYFAPRLEGIWARFPYLHNASIPNVAALLTPPEQRPRAFNLRDAGEVYRFDPEKLGLTQPERGSAEEKRIVELGEAGRRVIYLVTREGHGNGGHEFGTELTDDEKRDLIEYLKTL